MARQKIFTLQQLGNSLVEEVVAADTYLQTTQRNAWMEFRQGFPMAAGLGNLEYLGVNEFSFNLQIENVHENIFRKILVAIHLMKPIGAGKYRLHKPVKKRRPYISVTIKLTRQSLGNYKVDFVSANAEPLNPSETYVAGITQ